MGWFEDWLPLNGDGAFLVKGRGWHEQNWHLTHPDGKKLSWGGRMGNIDKRPQACVHQGYLIRDEFLTAVRRAKTNA